jgi:hypothetical protein
MIRGASYEHGLFKVVTYTSVEEAHSLIQRFLLDEDDNES